MLTLARRFLEGITIAMTDVFVVRNQHGHYWGKAKIWVDGSSPKAVLRTRYEDEALNTLFELSSRDIELRGEVRPTALSERGEPVIEPSQIPLLDESDTDATESEAQRAADA
tara:strand:- start:127 stop:462 length:336 start_codon:yes stop_codon:yes gene_type:complete